MFSVLISRRLGKKLNVCSVCVLSDGEKWFSEQSAKALSVT